MEKLVWQPQLSLSTIRESCALRATSAHPEQDRLYLVQEVTITLTKDSSQEKSANFALQEHTTTFREH
jgi:hypothetical protein